MTATAGVRRLPAGLKAEEVPFMLLPMTGNTLLSMPGPFAARSSASGISSFPKGQGAWRKKRRKAIGTPLLMRCVL